MAADDAKPPQGGGVCTTSAEARPDARAGDRNRDTPGATDAASAGGDPALAALKARRPKNRQLIVGADAHAETTQVLRWLADSGVVYAVGNVLTVIAPDAHLALAKKQVVLRAIAALARIMRRGPKDELVAAYPPAALVHAVAGPTEGDLAGFRRVDAVVDHPVHLPDGRRLGPGYHTLDHLYITGGDALRLPPLADALQRLEHLVHTFDFSTPDDLAAAVSAMLTAVSRPVLPTAPMIYVSAPFIASGKSLLCRLFALFLQPAEPPPKQLLDDGDELRKEILASLLNGGGTLFYDEIESDHFDSVALRTLLTSPTFSGRLLGMTREATVPCRVLVLACANNKSPGTDMTRRTLELRLTPPPDTAERTFTYDPLDDLRGNRRAYIAAALALQHWYFLSAQISDIPALGSYGDWHRLCRLPVIHAYRAIRGIEVDPAMRLRENMRIAAETSGASPLLKALVRELAPQDRRCVTAKLVAELARSSAAIREALLEVRVRSTRSPEDGCPQWNVADIGRRLADLRDRQDAGYDLRRRGLVAGTITYAIEPAGLGGN